MISKNSKDNLTDEKVSAAIITLIIEGAPLSYGLEKVDLTEDFLTDCLSPVPETFPVAKYKLNNLIELYGSLSDKPHSDTFVIKKILCNPDEFKKGSKKFEEVIKEMNNVISSDLPYEEYLDAEYLKRVEITKMISDSPIILGFKSNKSGYEVYLVQETNENNALLKTDSMYPVFYFTGSKFDVEAAKSMDELVNKIILYHNPKVIKELIDSDICGFNFE